MPTVHGNNNGKHTEYTASSANNDFWSQLGSNLSGFWNGVLDFFDFSGARASARQAEAQSELQDDAQIFNASEAQKERNWQEHMSNTAHQREVADLQAAGLNPWLSAGQAGASSSIGAAASSSQGNADMANNKTSLILAAIVAGLLKNYGGAAKAIKK